MPIFIGDVHGEWTKYNKIISELTESSLQIGDFGIGLGPWPGNDNYNSELMSKGGHMFGRGNHDNPEKCFDNPHYVPDGTMLDNGVFWVGGAYSVDRHNRAEGRDWWSNEELSMNELYSIMDRYEAEKPDIMASHDCPENIMHLLKSHTINDHCKNRTQQAFDGFLYIHRPKIWVFGHHHMMFDEMIDGTRFVCVPISSVVAV